MILKWFFPKYVYSNGLKSSSALNSFLSKYDFGVKKRKNQYFEENKGFGWSFNQIAAEF